MDIVLENDELANSDNNLTSEFGRNEGQGSWDSEEAENDQVKFFKKEKMKVELAINKIGEDLTMKNKQLKLQKKLRLADTLT